MGDDTQFPSYPQEGSDYLSPTTMIYVSKQNVKWLFRNLLMMTHLCGPFISI